MNALPPELSVLGLGLGLVLALGCYLLTNLSPGGMITPGWLALVLIVDPGFGVLIIGVAVVTFWVSRLIQRVVILYGKRLFATVVLVGVFLQITVFVFNSGRGSSGYSTLGFIIPGLLAYQLIRQPLVATLTATTVVASVAYTIILAGVQLHLIEAAPGRGQLAAEGLTGTPEIRFGVVHVAFFLLTGALGVAALLRSVWRPRGAASEATQLVVAVSPPAGDGESVDLETRETDSAWVEPVGQLGAEEPPAPEQGSEAAQGPVSYVGFVPTSDGYRLVELEGPPPAVGTQVETVARRFTVLRVGRSPLPSEARLCAYLVAA